MRVGFQNSTRGLRPYLYIGMSSSIVPVGFQNSTRGLRPYLIYRDELQHSPELSRYSSGPPGVEAKEPSESLATRDRAVSSTDTIAGVGKRDLVGQALMGSFMEKMGDVLVYDFSEPRLAEDDQATQAFLAKSPNPALRIRVEVGFILHLL